MSTRRQHTISGTLTEAKRNELPDSAFAFPKQREEPLVDAKHVRNALARFDQVEDVSEAERAAAFANIKAAADHYGGRDQRGQLARSRQTRCPPLKPREALRWREALMRRSASTAFATVATLAALTACGSSAKSASQATSPAVTGGTVAAAPLTTTTPTPSSPAPTTVPPAGGGLANFCALSKQFKAKYASMSDLSETDPTEVKAFFASFDADIATWEAAAPADIKAAVMEDTKAIAQLETLLKKYNYDFTKAISDPTLSSFVVQSTSTSGTTADDSITAYVKDKCGITEDTVPTIDSIPIPTTPST